MDSVKYGDKCWGWGEITALIVIGQSLSQMETIQMIYCFTNTDIDNKSGKCEIAFTSVESIKPVTNGAHPSDTE